MTCAADDMLELVQAELTRRQGDLRAIAKAADMHYDTVRRIRRGQHDPAYSKVKRLASQLGLMGHQSGAAATGAPQEMRDAA